LGGLRRLAPACRQPHGTERCVGVENGAGWGSRTPTPFRAALFESAMSACSINPAVTTRNTISCLTSQAPKVTNLQRLRPVGGRVVLHMGRRPVSFTTNLRERLAPPRAFWTSTRSSRISWWNSRLRLVGGVTRTVATFTVVPNPRNTCLLVHSFLHRRVPFVDVVRHDRNESAPLLVRRSLPLVRHASLVERPVPMKECRFVASPCHRPRGRA